MKTYSQFNESLNTVDGMMIALNKTKIADNFSIRSYQEIYKDDMPDVYELSAEIVLANRQKSINSFEKMFNNIKEFMEKNFNYYETLVSSFSKKGSVALSFKMSIEDLESSNFYKTYKTIDKYNL